MKKFLNYLQLFLAINFIMVLTITGIHIFLPNPELYLSIWDTAVRFGLLINITYIAGILLREIPYLRAKDSDDYIGWYTCTGIIAAVTAGIFCLSLYGSGNEIPADVYGYLKWGIPMYILLVALIHPRYALSSLIIIVGIKGFWEGGLPSVYLYTLAALLMVGVLGTIIKLAFSRKWSTYGGNYRRKGKVLLPKAK